MKTTKVWKKVVAVVLAAVIVLGMTPLSQLPEIIAVGENRTIFFKPGVWNVDNAWYQAWVWGSSTESDHWVTASDSNGDGVYEFTVPADATGMKIYRKSTDHASNNFDQYWNDSGDLSIDNRNCYSITGWGSGSWSTITVEYNVSFNLTNLTRSSGATSATSGSSYTATLSASSGYTLPTSITVTVGGTRLTSGTDYAYNSTTGVLTIYSSAITGDITITATGVKATTTYTVRYSLNNLSYSGSTSATSGSSYTATLSPADGYHLPDSITVQVGGRTINSGYTYDKSTGELTINSSAVTGNIVITASGEEDYYVLVGESGLTGENWNSESTKNIMAANGNGVYSITYEDVPAGSYEFKVYKNGDYNQGQWPLYNNYVLDLSATSNVTISLNINTHEITVTPNAVTYDVEFSGSGISFDGADTAASGMNYTATLTANSGYAVSTVAVKVGNTTLSSGTDYAYDSSTGALTIYSSAITGDISITATSVRAYTVTFTGANVTSDGASTAVSGRSYTATLSPADGYHLPDSITITRGGRTLGSQYYTYDSTTGELTIDGSAITGNIVITAAGVGDYYVVVGDAGLTGENWNSSSTENIMAANGNGVYSITYEDVPADSYEFKVYKNGDYTQGQWPLGNNYKQDLTATGSGNSTFDVTITFNLAENKISVDYTEKKAPAAYEKDGVINLDSDKVFYVDVDLVDYLNDNRVANGEVYGYYKDNQGIWLTDGDAPYSYLNHLISQQAYYNNYSHPLYFGPLYYIESRYSREVGNATYQNLGKWSSAANVALAADDGKGTMNADAVVQGLLDEFYLDANGNLVSKSKTDGEGNPLPFLYFSETAANKWLNNGKQVMAYYADLQFPFVMEYDTENRVTKYSYDSAKDYAVYYDYENSQLYASSKHILDSVNDDDASPTDYGFYPLNAPNDTGNEVNNGFGAKFTIDFTVGEDGKLASGDAVTFDFTGDDDVWVFIDGKLVLDMGGAHAKAHGHIDFAKLEATVTDAASVGNSYVINGDSDALGTYKDQGLSNWLYNDYSDTYNVERATMDSGEVTKKFSELGITNFDYNAVHTMTVFYMERGMLESNFSMEFTMVPVPSGLTISKNLNDADINKGLLDEVSAVEDFNFSLSATSPNNTSVAFAKYTLTEKYTGETRINNVTGSTSGSTYTAAISGITNYTYAHSFVTANGEDAFIPGTTFTIVETTKDIFEYSKTTWAIYDANNSYRNITSSVKTNEANTSSKTAEFIMGSENDTTAYSYAVSFTNTMKVGTLQVQKNVSDSILENTEFKFKVLLDLDGSKNKFTAVAYSGLVYTVDGNTKTADENGIITLKGGETAVISGIPVGATYQVIETPASTDVWEQTASQNTTGTITTGTVTASFTNSLKTSTLQITKEFNSSWMTDTKFTFTVYVDADGDGSAYRKSLYTGSYKVGNSNKNTSNGIITLTGGQTAVITGLPVGATYEVIETPSSNGTWEQTDSDNATGTITSGTVTASFTNTLKTGTLEISKVFNSRWLTDTEFTFTVYVDADGSGSSYSERLYTGSYKVGNSNKNTSNGIIILTGGQTAVISGLPANATYRVVETEPNNAAWELTSSSGTTGTITSGGTKTAAFTNTLKTGTLEVSKVFSDDKVGNTQFTFTVRVDADGDGDAYDEVPYSGSYTVGNRSYSTDNGTITLTAGQTAVISGLPANATYSVAETVPSNAAWELASSSGTTGTITSGGTKTATFTNVYKTVSADKVIYVEAGTPTKYTLTYGSNNISDITVLSVDGVSVSLSGSKLTVTGEDPNEAYTLTYKGRLPDGTVINGTITVYTFEATHKVYVFDFGLPSNLADTGYNDGLFQGGYFFNSNVNGESAKLTAVTADKKKPDGASYAPQTMIEPSAENLSIYSNGSIGEGSTVTFTPIAFMSQVEYYTYTVQITASGKTFDANNPETGTTVTGTIKVMPANTVYYEDNFNVEASDKDPAKEMVFSDGVTAPTQNPELEQSNDQSTNYGKDECYNGGYTISNGSETTLTSGQYAYFTFTGTGFDLISRTNGSTAGFAVYVFAGENRDAYADYLTSFSGATPEDMVFVDTYYNNGDLYQVPVVSVRLEAQDTYTVYIQALATSNTLTTVSIDGIRIYNPLADTSLYPLANEMRTTVAELRVLYGIEKIVSLASRVNGEVGAGTGRPVSGAIIEDMENKPYSTSQELKEIYTHGPNNEMYLPQDFGIQFSYHIDNPKTWTMQIGAKALNSSKSFTVYARKTDNTSGYEEVGTVSVESTTDMYYDLTKMLTEKGYGVEGSYDIIIISNSDDSSSNFVSLTTVKYSGITLS